MGKFKMDGRLFLPKTVDNTFRGMAAAKYVFFAIAAITVVRGLLYIILPEGDAQSIATILLLGLTQLMVGALYWVAALRYKSLIPLMYACVAAEYAGRFVFGRLYPVAPIGTAPGEIANYVLLPLAGVMLLLSLIYRERRAPESRMR